MAHRLRWIFALAALAAGAAGAWFAREVPVDATNEPFFVKQDASWADFERFSRDYGSTESIAAGIELPQGLTPESAAQIEAIEADLAKVPGIGGLMGLSSVREYRLVMLRVEPSPLLEPLKAGRETAAQFLARRSSWPPQARHLVSPDGHMAAVVLFLDSGSRASGETIDAVRKVLEHRRVGGGRFILTGGAVEQQTFSRKIEEDRRIFVPLCIGAIVVLLLFYYRDWATLVYALAVMGGSLALAQGAMVVFHAKLHAVTSLLAPVILIVAVSSTVKASGIFYITPDDGSPESRVRRALAAMFVPCFLANVTTVIGFLSLLVSRIPAVRDFGFYGAIGTTAAFSLTLLLAPLFTGFTRPGRGGGPADRTGLALARWTEKAAPLILAAAVIFAAVSLSSVGSIRTSTDFIKVFKADDPFRRDTESFQKNFGGVYSLEIEVEPDDPKTLQTTRAWDALDRFEEELLRLPGATHAFGAPDLVRYFERDVAQMRRAPMVLDRILSGLVSEPSQGPRLWTGKARMEKLRFTLFLDSADTKQTVETIGRIPAIARGFLGKDWRARVTGETRLLSEMSERLVSDEVASVSTAFGVIFVLLLLTVRSLPYSLLCIVPNFLPIAGLFGSMALLGIDLNTSTAMIASVTIGLIFDNTVYLLYGFREARAAGLEPAESVRRAMDGRVKPMLASSLLLCAGFGVTTFGQMTPTAQFGLLSCLTIVFATLSDLLVVPSLLHRLKPGR